MLEQVLCQQYTIRPEHLLYHLQLYLRHFLLNLDEHMKVFRGLGPSKSELMTTPLKIL